MNSELRALVHVSTDTIGVPQNSEVDGASLNEAAAATTPSIILQPSLSPDPSGGVESVDGSGRREAVESSAQGQTSEVISCRVSQLEHIHVGTHNE